MFKKVPQDSIRFRKFKKSRKIKMVHEDSKTGLEGLERFKKIQEGSQWFMNV